LQIDSENRTGIVNVKLENGQPSYEIVENVAWDFLEFSDDSKTCDAVCFGTLAQRGIASQNTIQEFVRTSCLNSLLAFDINFRQNYFSAELMRKSLEVADVVKLNHEELPIIVEMFSIKGSNQIEQAKFLREKLAVRTLCVTRGGNGSWLIDENDVCEHQGVKVKIADTIGAGDAFTATLVHGLLRSWNLEKFNEFANKVGAFVASKPGAMPEFEEFEFIL
jgi:fructokinase